MKFTLRNVADKTGMNKVTCYNHFKQLTATNDTFKQHSVKRDRTYLMDKLAFKLIVGSFTNKHKLNANRKRQLTKTEKDKRIADLQATVRRQAKIIDRYQKAAILDKEAKVNRQQLELNNQKGREAKLVNKRPAGLLTRIKNFFK